MAERGGGLGDAAIVRTEIVTPLRHAMGLVHRQQANAGLAHFFARLRFGQTLRREIKQPQFAPGQRPAAGLRFANVLVHVQGASGQAPRGKLRHLVAHQRDQRRDHQAQAGTGQGRILIDQALAAAGRPEDEQVFAGERGGHGLRLQGQEIVETEQGPQGVSLAVEIDRQFRHPASPA